jgi:nicotinamide riboside kinase
MTPQRTIRVCATGAECTGKSSLARDLASRFEAPLVEEYNRTYFTRKMATGDATVFAGDLVRVIGEQSRREDLVAAEHPELMICDTDVFTVAVWHERYVGGRKREIDLLAELRREEGAGMDLYLLCAPDFPFAPDEVRTGEPLRTAMHGVFRERLEEMGYPYVELTGPHAERQSKAITEIQRLLLADE